MKEKGQKLKILNEMELKNTSINERKSKKQTNENQKKRP